MNNQIRNLFSFMFGVAIGSAVTWKILKRKYDDALQEKIYSKLHLEEGCHEEKPREDSESVNEADVDSLLHEYGRCFESDEELIANSPCVISPEEYGENEEYDQISLTYYEDGILADDLDEIVEDIDGTVGAESLGHFGEYEDDSVFVRNDRLKCYYEILLDQRLYSEVTKNSPRRSEE